MARFILAGHFGPADSITPMQTAGEHLARLDLLAGQRTLRFGIGGALHHLAKLTVYPSETGVDLMVLAAMVHAADTRLNRIQTSQDGWTREIGLVVPVSDPARWRLRETLLNGMLRFLTGDLWDVSFRARPPEWENLVRCPLQDLEPHGFQGVALFSGGLDSLIGAIDTLVDGRRPLFISHAGEGAVSKPQRDVFDRVAEAYGRDGVVRRLRLAMTFPRHLMPGVGGENSTRGRSFLFLALAAFAGSGLHIPFTLEVPENGLIALNVPLDPTRLGSLSTRTTHPYYLHRWNELLAALGIPGTVTNPYWDKTKGEMVKACKDQAFLRTVVAMSVSCAHPSTDRYHGGGFSHCGRCVPCLIRRAAIEHAWGANSDPTGYRIQDLSAAPLDPLKAEGIQVRGFQYALERLKACPGLARLLIHKPGPLREDADRIDALSGVYSRGMAEVGELLQDVETHPAAWAGGP